jgi:hypothetical protein
VIRNRTAEIVAELEAKYPGWHVYPIHHAVGGITWCAQRHGEDVSAFQAGSPDELAWEIEQEGG